MEACHLPAQRPGPSPVDVSTRPAPGPRPGRSAPRRADGPGHRTALEIGIEAKSSPRNASTEGSRVSGGTRPSQPGAPGTRSRSTSLDRAPRPSSVPGPPAWWRFAEAGGVAVSLALLRIGAASLLRLLRL